MILYDAKYEKLMQNYSITKICQISEMSKENIKNQEIKK